MFVINLVNGVSFICYLLHLNLIDWFGKFTSAHRWIEEFETELRFFNHSKNRFLAYCQRQQQHKHTFVTYAAPNERTSKNCVMKLKMVKENHRCDNPYREHEAVQRGRSTSIKRILCSHYINNNTEREKKKEMKKTSRKFVIWTQHSAYLASLVYWFLFWLEVLRNLIALFEFI